MMAIAIRCKTFKEAQASNTIVILGVSLLPLLTLFNDSGEQPWHLWVPALAQITLMGRVLRGEAFAAADLLMPLVVAARPGRGVLGVHRAPPARTRPRVNPETRRAGASCRYAACSLISITRSTSSCHFSVCTTSFR